MYNPSNETIRLEASYTPTTIPTFPSTLTTTAGEATGYTSPPQATTGERTTTTERARGETTATLTARSGANTKLIAAVAVLIIILAAATLVLRR